MILLPHMCFCVASPVSCLTDRALKESDSHGRNKLDTDGTRIMRASACVDTFPVSRTLGRKLDTSDIRPQVVHLHISHTPA